VGAPEAILVGVVALLVFGPKGLAEAVKAVGATLRTFQPAIRELASVSSELRSTLEEQIGLDDIKAELSAAVAPLPPPATKKVKKKKEEEEVEAAEVKGEGTANDANGEEDEEDGEREIFDTRPSLSEYAASMGAEKIDPDIEAKRAVAAAAAWGTAGAIPRELSSDDGGGGSDARSSGSSSPSSSSTPVQGAALEAAMAAAAAASSSSPPSSPSPAKSLDGLSIEDLEAELARRRGA
jgi:TatA/E family protein of Tat protein translocase